MHTPARTNSRAQADQKSMALTSDCSQCTALCCITMGFFAEQGFGFNKPANTPCPHLSTDFKCTIHAERAAAGFGGCIMYDCHGAGQRVTRAFHLKLALSRPQRETNKVVELFRRVQTMHEMMALLHTAISHLRDEKLVNDFTATFTHVDAQCASLLDGGDIDEVAIHQRVSEMLASLKEQTEVLISLRGG